MNSKNAISKGATELFKTDFSNISVPTMCPVQVTMQVNDQLKVIEIPACSKNTMEVADREVHDVVFTSPPITSTPHSKPIRMSSCVIRHPKSYGSSNVRVMPKEKPKVCDDIKVSSMEDAIQMNMEYIKEQVLLEQGKGESEVFAKVQRLGVKRQNTSTGSEKSANAAKLCKEMEHVQKEVATKNIAEHHD